MINHILSNELHNTVKGGKIMVSYFREDIETLPRDELDALVDDRITLHS